jgi:small subunit ribosomal protein S8e
MAIQQSRSKRGKTGTRYKWRGAKKTHELGREPSLTGIGEKRVIAVRGRGNNKKDRMLTAQIANVLDKKTKKFTKAKIKTVVENPANRNYVRRNIITKGAIVDTEKGKARVTSRPGQDGVVNAVLVD